MNKYEWRPKHVTHFDDCGCLSFRCVNEHANAQRIIDWINNPKRKPAHIAFTEGPERQIAYAIEKQKNETVDKALALNCCGEMECIKALEELRK